MPLAGVLANWHYWIYITITTRNIGECYDMPDFCQCFWLPWQSKFYILTSSRRHFQPNVYNKLVGKLNMIKALAWLCSSWIVVSCLAYLTCFTLLIFLKTWFTFLSKYLKIRNVIEKPQGLGLDSAMIAIDSCIKQTRVPVTKTH